MFRKIRFYDSGEQVAPFSSSVQENAKTPNFGPRASLLRERLIGRPRYLPLYTYFTLNKINQPSSFPFFFRRPETYRETSDFLFPTSLKLPPRTYGVYLRRILCPSEVLGPHHTPFTTPLGHRPRSGLTRIVCSRRLDETSPTRGSDVLDPHGPSSSTPSIHWSGDWVVPSCLSFSLEVSSPSVSSFQSRGWTLGQSFYFLETFSGP